MDAQNFELDALALKSSQLLDFEIQKGLPKGFLNISFFFFRGLGCFGYFWSSSFFLRPNFVETSDLESLLDWTLVD
jgi:hypothetical protein